MPYITPDERPSFAGHIAQMHMDSPGDLAFVLFWTCLWYMHNHGRSYQTFCEIEGALGGTAREFYRRVTAPYEDKKIEDNGDII